MAPPPAALAPPRLPRRRGIVAALSLAAAATLAGGGRQRAAATPTAALALLVGGSPGRGPDRWARGFAPFLERHAAPRSAVSVLNLPGEGGLAAARALAESAPDGRTLGLVTVPALIARCIERGEEGLLDRLAFIAPMAEEPVVLVAPAAVAASSTTAASAPADIAALKALGPGGLLGTPPPGGAAQLAAGLLAAALPLQRLAFPNAPAARRAAITGNVAAALLPLPEAVAGLRDGRLTGLAIAQERRCPLVPEIPTFAEQGLPPLRMANQRGLAVPRGVPAERIAALAAALRAAIEDPEFAAQAETEGYLPRTLAPAEWQATLSRLTAELRARWERDPWVPGAG